MCVFTDFLRFIYILWAFIFFISRYANMFSQIVGYHFLLHTFVDKS